MWTNVEQQMFSALKMVKYKDWIWVKKKPMAMSKEKLGERPVNCSEPKKPQSPKAKKKYPAHPVKIFWNAPTSALNESLSLTLPQCYGETAAKPAISIIIHPHWLAPLLAFGHQYFTAPSNLKWHSPLVYFTAYFNASDVMSHKIVKGCAGGKKVDAYTHRNYHFIPTRSPCFISHRHRNGASRNVSVGTVSLLRDMHCFLIAGEHQFGNWQKCLILPRFWIWCVIYLQSTNYDTFCSCCCAKVYYW